MGLRKVSQAGKTIFHFSENIFEQPAPPMRASNLPASRSGESTGHRDAPGVNVGLHRNPPRVSLVNDIGRSRTTSSFPVALSATFSEQRQPGLEIGLTCDD